MKGPHPVQGHRSLNTEPHMLKTWTQGDPQFPKDQECKTFHNCQKHEDREKA